MQAILRKYGNSIGLAIPKGCRNEHHHFEVGQTVILEEVEEGLLIKPVPIKKYSLDDLLNQCDLKAEEPTYDSDWENMPPVGKEIW